MDKMLERILDEAKKRGIQKQEICQACGIDQCNFAGWINGRTSSYKKYVLEIADLLGVSVTYLIKGEESPAEAFYTKYCNASERTRKMIDLLLEEEDAK